MSMQKEAPDAAKETRKQVLRYVARYGGIKTLVCAVYGQRIVEIYLRRGFVEIDKETFNRIKAEGV